MHCDDEFDFSVRHAEIDRNTNKPFVIRCTILIRILLKNSVELVYPMYICK